MSNKLNAIKPQQLKTHSKPYLLLIAFMLSSCGGSDPTDVNNPPDPLSYTGNENQAIITKTNAAKLIALVSQSKDLGSSDPITPSHAGAHSTKTPINLSRIIEALSNSRISQLSASIDGYAAKSASNTGGDCLKSGSFAAGDNGLFRFYSCDDNNSVILNGSIRVLGNKQTYSVEYLGYTMSFIDTGPDYDAIVELGGSSAWHYNDPDAPTRVDITLNTVIKDYVSGSEWLTKNYIYTEIAGSTATNSPYTTAFNGDVYDSVLGFVSVVTTTPFDYSGVDGNFPSHGRLIITGVTPTNAEFIVGAPDPDNVKVSINAGADPVDSCTTYLTWAEFTQADYSC